MWQQGWGERVENGILWPRPQHYAHPSSSVQPAGFWHLMAMRFTSARLVNGSGNGSGGGGGGGGGGGQDRTFPGIFVG